MLSIKCTVWLHLNVRFDCKPLRMSRCVRFCAIATADLKSCNLRTIFPCLVPVLPECWFACTPLA